MSVISCFTTKVLVRRLNSCFYCERGAGSLIGVFFLIYFNNNLTY